MDAHHPSIRALFTRDYLLSADWYRERLAIKQQRDAALWRKHIQHLVAFLDLKTHRDEAELLDVEQRLANAKQRLAEVESAEYLESLVGTLGADPLGPSQVAEDAEFGQAAA